MAILVLAQASGAGTQADNASLETAWQGLPVTATLSDEGAGSTYLHELLGDSPSEGLTVSVANASSRIATYTHTGGSGSYRIRATVTDPAGVQTVFVRVVRVTKDVAGETLDGGLIKPAFGERPGESTADARGAAGVYDRNVELFATNVASDRAWSPVMRIDRTFRTVATADAFGKVSFALDHEGHVTGAQALVYIEADTVAAATDLVWPSDLDPFDGADPFDPTREYAMLILVLDGTGAGRFKASLVDVGTRTTTAPTFTAEIAGDLDKLVLVFDAPTMLPDLAGVSLTGTTPEVASIFSVSDDLLTWTIDLDGDISSGDTVSLVLASSCTWRALNCGKVAAGTYAVTTAYDFTSVPGATLWFDPPVHCNVTTDGGAVTALNTTVGSGQDFTGTGTYRATGLNGKPGIEGNGSSNVFNTAGLISSLLSASEYYMLLAVKVDGPIPTDSGTPYLNEAVLSDVAAYGPNLTFRLTGTKAQLYQYDGASNKLDEVAITTGVVQVISLRLKSGQLYIGLNGTEGAGVACGNVQAAALASTLRLLRGAGGGGSYFDGTLGRLLICNSDPGATIRDAAEAAMVAFYA